MYPDLEINRFGRYDRKQQQSTLNIDGDGTLSSSFEVQSLPYSGLRSNLVTSGTNNIATISIADDFNSGVTLGITNVHLDTPSNNATFTESDTSSWPTGDMGSVNLPEGWDYTPANQNEQFGLITNNTGRSVDLSSATFRIVINMVELPSFGQTTPSWFVRQNSDVILAGNWGTINSTGTNVSMDNSSGSYVKINNGESLILSLSENVDSEKGFIYNISSVRLTLPAITSSSYTLDIDTTNSVFSGNVSNTFNDNVSPTTALTSISTDVISMFPTITAGEVYDSVIDVTTLRTAENRANGHRNWNLVDAPNFSADPSSYTTWDGWISRFFKLEITDSQLSYLSMSLQSEDTLTNVSLSLVDEIDSTISATFVIDNVIIDGELMFYSIASVTSQSGVPKSAFTTGFDVTLSASIGCKSIDLNTQQSINITQILTLNENSGNTLFGEVESTFATETSGQASTYTVIDPYGIESISFTSFVSSETESDIDYVITTIVNAINNNIEMPIDFIAEPSGTDIIVTAQDIGVVPSFWLITANHHNQVDNAGDISFGVAERISAGAILSLTLSGGGMDSDIVLSQASLTKSAIIQGLTNNLPLGVELYNDPIADFAIISDDSEEQPELSLTISGNQNDPFVFTTQTKYWGHD